VPVPNQIVAAQYKHRTGHQAQQHDVVHVLRTEKGQRVVIPRRPFPNEPKTVAVPRATGTQAQQGKQTDCDAGATGTTGTTGTGAIVAHEFLMVGGRNISNTTKHQQQTQTPTTQSRPTTTPHQHHQHTLCKQAHQTIPDTRCVRLQVVINATKQHTRCGGNEHVHQKQLGPPYKL
jgi:hypothetical protein